MRPRGPEPWQRTLGDVGTVTHGLFHEKHWQDWAAMEWVEASS